MKSLVVALVVSCVGGVLAGDGVWDYSNAAGLLPTAPADWSDSANWVDGNVPSGQNATAYLVDKNQTASMAGTLRYIEVPAGGVTLGGLRSQCGVQLYVTGGPIALTDRDPSLSQNWARLVDTADGQSSSKVYYFNAMTFGDIYLGRSALAGVLRPKTESSELIAVGQVTMIPYRQALTDSETIVDPAYNGRIRPGTGGAIGYYAPAGTDGATGVWKVTEGSSFLERVGSAHSLAAGQHVTGAGIPAGAFVKRIYTAALVEISAPATSSSASDAGTTLEFAAFTPTVRQNIALLAVQGDGWLSFSPMKMRPQDDVVYTVDRLVTSKSQAYEVATDAYASHFNILPGTQICPARTIFREVDSTKKGLRLVHADVMFDDGVSVTTTCARVTLGGRGSVFSVAWPTGSVNVAVSSGKVTQWGALEQFEGVLTKTGEGELSIVPACSLNLSTLIVNEGRVTLAGDDTARTLAALRLSEGAALTVAEGQDLTVKSAVLASGSSLHVGRGTRLEFPSGTSLAGVTITGDGVVTVLGYGTDVKQFDSGTPLVSGSQVNPCVVGTPAFWVTADSLAAATPAGTLEQVGDNLEIVRWNDCRSAADGGTMFATNHALRPRLVTSGARPCVYIAGSSTKAANHGLVWNQPLMNIRAVFVVHDLSHGYYGSLLGSSSRLGSVFDFIRGSPSSNGALFYSMCSSAIANSRAVCYLNGRELPAYNSNLYQAMGNKNGLAVIEVEPTGDCRADAFASSPETGTFANRWDLVGNDQLLECIVYTNTLSYVERYNVHAYLMKKYGILPLQTNSVAFCDDKRTRVDDLALPAGASGQVSVSSGCSATIQTLASNVGVEKTGAGTLYVSEAANAGALSVRAGTLVVSSPGTTAASLLPSDTALRFDASDLTTITYAWDAERGLNTITKWTDIVKGIEATLKQASHTNRPFVLPNALNGKSVVDFGPAIANIPTTPDTEPNPCLKFTPHYKLRTVFSVIGSERGGNTLLGGSSGRNDSYAQRFNNKQALGLWRDVQSHPGDLTRPLVEASESYSMFTKLDVLQVRKNGEAVDQTKSYFSGAYDLFSLNAMTNMDSDVLGAIHYAKNAGGMQLAETIFYNRNLDLKEIEDVEAYLDYKWFNRRRPGYAPASAKKVDVAEGAVLRVLGDSPLTVASLSCAGTIQGSVRLADASTFTVTVNGDGTVTPVSIAGSVDVSAGGTIVLTGATDTLGFSTYEIMRTTSFASDVGKWTVELPAHLKRYDSRLEIVGNSLYLKISKPGLFMIVR